MTALAVEEWDAGRSAEARALFLLAHGLKPSARTLRALGKTAFELRLYPDAVRELSAALADSRQTLDANMRREVQALLERAQAFVGRYHIQVQPADAQLRVDGAEAASGAGDPLLLGLGRHVLELEAPGYRHERYEILVAGNQGESLHFRLSPQADESFAARSAGELSPAPPLSTAPPGRSERRWRENVWGLSVAGGSAALGATSFALYLKARKEDERVERVCDGGCDPRVRPLDELTHKRDGLIRWSYLTLSGASLLAVGAVVLYCIERRHRTRSAPGIHAARRRGYTRLLDPSTFHF